MAEIIQFPALADAAREEAIEALALRLCAYLSTSFYRQGILDVPVQAFVYDMKCNMLRDGIEYDQEIIERLSTDPAMLKRVEKMFIAALIERGILPIDFV